MEKSVFKKIILAASLVLATALTISCGQHWDDFLNSMSASFNALTSNNLLQNQRLGFTSSSEEGVPSGNANVIKDVKISGNAINGGSTSITVTSSEELEELYLQIGDEAGYYRWILDPEDLISSNPDYVYFIVLEFNRSLGDEGNYVPFVVSGKTKGGEITVEQEKELKVEKAKSGKMQISVSWDINDDVDLHVFTPSGVELYYGTRETGNPDIDSNPACDIDGINSENVYFDVLEPGDYKVEVHLYQKCSGSNADGARYYVTANIKGQFINFDKRQVGQFKKTDTYFVKNEIGTIKIGNNENCTNCY